MKTTEKNARNKRQLKKQTNIKWNSRLFFQVGVIASLLIVFFIMQTNFEMRPLAMNPDTSDSFVEPPIITYVLDVEKPKPAAPEKKVVQKRVEQKVVKSSTFDVKPDTAPVVKTPIAPDNSTSVETPTAPAVPDATPVDSKPHTVINVEFVPVFPGCEALATNAEKIDCMSSKINAFVNKNFRKELLEDLQPNQIHRIYVNFKIDSNGFVTDVVANSHNAKLKKEAQRVINNLPSMRPGKQGDKNVEVLYSVPIAFNIH